MLFSDSSDFAVSDDSRMKQFNSKTDISIDIASYF
jgi:hypothetical protein